MLKANPEAVWVLQSWLHNPETEVIAGLKKDQTLVIDLGNERDNGWLRDAPVAFTNIPWVYSVIHNFGGRIGNLCTPATYCRQPFCDAKSSSERQQLGE